MTTVPGISFKKKIFLYLYMSVSRTDHTQVCLKKTPSSEFVTEISIIFSAR
jgi:hypothetical protein